MLQMQELRHRATDHTAHHVKVLGLLQGMVSGLLKDARGVQQAAALTLAHSRGSPNSSPQLQLPSTNSSEALASSTAANWTPPPYFTTGTTT